MAKDRQKYVTNYSHILRKINDNIINLRGLTTQRRIICLAEQIFDSIRRINYIFYIRNAEHSEERMDPRSPLFDPLKAAVMQYRLGQIDEACWLVFIAAHFGKHKANGWRLARKIYGKLDRPDIWNWEAIHTNPEDFSTWLQNNQVFLVNEKFSNHRKYESLRADTRSSTAIVFQSYVEWVNLYGDHSQMIRSIHRQVGQHPKEVFDFLYRSMDTVKRFGRLGRFDFLTMLGKLGIFPIEPGSAYLWHKATGPIRGARLLFGGDVEAAINPDKLDQLLINLDAHLNIGMQALEDSLCNWQKNPEYYQRFRG